MIFLQNNRVWLIISWCLQAIDVWNNICVSFVFLALLEYALVNYAARADARYTPSLISFPCSSLLRGMS